MAKPSPHAFATGPMAANPLAAAFAPAPAGLHLPDVALRDQTGRPRRSNDLLGKPALVSLWAEWCAPCLAEAHDLSTLAAGRPAGVTVLAMLTGSAARLDGPEAHARLARAGAEALPSWVEPYGGDTLLKVLAGGAMNKGGELPCTVILDRHGRVRGRMIGARFASLDPRLLLPSSVSPQGRMTDKGKRLMETLPLRSVFAGPAAAACLRLLAAGALDDSHS